MSLDHVLLVSLSEQPGSGAELTRRFDRSIGYFWHATHQQIYRSLGRMEVAGWISFTTIQHPDRPASKRYVVTSDGEAALREWLSNPTPLEGFRAEIMVKFRAGAYGDRAALIRAAQTHLAEHRARKALYEQLEAKGFPDPDKLTDQELDQYLVLRGGLELEQFWIDWLENYLRHQTSRHPQPHLTGASA